MSGSSVLVGMSRPYDPVSGKKRVTEEITDERWHRVGLVWDGSKMMLSADDIVVAEDAQTGLFNSDRGLCTSVAFVSAQMGLL